MKRRAELAVCLCAMVVVGCGLPESAPLATNGTGELHEETTGSLAAAAGSEQATPDRLEPARQAIERTLRYLQADSTAWMDGTTEVQGGDGCVSCHQVPFGLWALREADRVGLMSAEQRADVEDLAVRAIEFVTPERIGRVMSWTPLILAELHTAGELPPSPSWLAIGESIADRQRSEGFWRARGQFPAQRRELDETNSVATLWTLVALSQLEPLGEILETSRRRALSWIEAEGEGESSEWLMARLLVANDSGPGLERLLALQSPDGGWGWAPGEPSNAFSTGQAVYTLTQVGGGSGSARVDAAVDSGVDYLVAGQGDEGVWTVPSALITTEASDAHDYVYDYWGTAWAVIGLARALEPGSHPTVAHSTIADTETALP